jgi:hypothetical protein
VESRFLCSPNFPKGFTEHAKDIVAHRPSCGSCRRPNPSSWNRDICCNSAVAVAFADRKRAAPLFLAFDTMYPSSTLHRASVRRRKRHEASHFTFHNVPTSSSLRPEEVYNTPGKPPFYVCQNTRQSHRRCSSSIVHLCLDTISQTFHSPQLQSSTHTS